MFHDNAPKLAGTVITLAVLAYIVLPLRVYTRIKNKTWGMDDTSIVIGMIPFTLLTVFCLGGSFRGVGVHEWRLSEHEKSVGLMWFFFFEIFYCAAIIPIKLSISFMLMRIASPRREYIWALYSVSIMFTAMNLIAFFYIVFHCSPVRYAWDTTVVGGKCNPASALADIYYATTAVNIVTDWFCALLPVPLLWSVQLNRNSKLSVACLLSLGVLASLSACIRLNYTINLTDSDDYLFGVGDIVIWGYAENGIGMIVGCISTLRPLFRRMFSLGGSSGGPSAKTPWTATGRAYQEFESSYEMRPDKVDAQTTVRARRSSSIRDTASEEHILSDVGQAGGIQISRSVLQDVSYSGKSRDDDVSV